MDVDTVTPSILSQSLSNSIAMENSVQNSMDSTNNLNSDPKKAANQYDSLKMKYFLSLGMNRPPPQMSSSVPLHSYMSSSLKSTNPMDYNNYNSNYHLNSNNTTISNHRDSVTSNGINIANNNNNKPRYRTKTAPPLKHVESEEGDYRKRTISVPIPISSLTGPPTGPIPTMAASLGTYLTNSSFDDEDEEDNYNTNNNSNGSSHSDNNAREHERMFNTSSGSPLSGIEKDEIDIFDDDDDEEVSKDRMRHKPNPNDSPIKFIPPHELLANSKKDFNVGTAHSVAVWEQRRRKFI